MPSRALSRRDPPNGKNGFSIARGFTVIEMMIAVAVLAIITSLALPSYRAIMEKRQVTSGAERLSAFLGSVQLESIKRYENVTVSLETNLYDASTETLVWSGQSATFNPNNVADVIKPTTRLIVNTLVDEGLIKSK